MANLLDSVKDVLTDALMDKAAGAIGMDGSSMTSAVGKFLPGIIGGLIGKGSSESGAGQILNLLGGDALKNFDLGNLTGMLGDQKQTSSLMDMGGNLLNGFLGNKQSGLLESLMSMTGVNKSGGSMLMKFLAPIVLKKLGGMVMSNGWGAKALSSYLGTQKSSIASAIPGMGSLLGFANNAKETASAATSAARETVSSGGGGGWMKWLLPLLLIGAAAWYFTKDGCAAKAGGADANVEMTGGDVTNDGDATTTISDAANTTTDVGGGDAATMTTTTTDGGSVDYSNYKMLDNGDVVDGTGAVVIKSGSYGLDANGNLISDAGAILIPSASLPVSFLDRLKSYLGKYAGTKLSVNDAGDLVDASGTVILKKGEYQTKNGFYVDKDGNKMGRIWGKIVEAIKGAAKKTKEAMTSLFSDMVTKKDGASGDYYLSNIKWDPSGNRITSFSKGEIEGLAAALKANADGKIVVKATTNDGKNDKANKKMAKDRANVVHDMLIALGVKASQLSFEGAAGENNVAVVVK